MHIQSHTHRHGYTQRETQPDTNTARHADIQTHRHTHKHIDTQNTTMINYPNHSEVGTWIMAMDQSLPQ